MREQVGNPVGEVDAELVHRLDHLGVDALAGVVPAERALVAALGGAFEERLAHLRAAGVVEADEECVSHSIPTQRVESGTPITSRRRLSPPMAKSRISSALGAEGVPVGPLAIGRGQRLGHGRQQLAQGRAHRSARAGLCGDGLAQEPDAVADVALLVVVDLRVAVDESRQQALAFQVAGDEVERGEAEGPLEDQVVEGDEADLCLGVGGIGDEPLVGLDQGDVEDRPKGRRDLLAGALDVGGDRRRVGDDLVLEAGVELHVARLVDLLGGEEGRLLLAAVGARPARRTWS